MKTNVFYLPIFAVVILFFASCTDDANLEELQQIEEFEHVQFIEPDEIEEDDT